jgi:sugar phosphate permease
MLRRCSTLAEKDSVNDGGDDPPLLKDPPFAMSRSHPSLQHSCDEVDIERLQLTQIRLLACTRGVFQMARICMGPLAVNIAAEYGYNAEQKGSILSAFAAGYAITQILGGLGADRFGGKPILLMGLVTSGGGLLLLPFAANAGLSQLWLLLWMMGVTQGPTYPAQIATTAKWASGSLRSYASALGGTGSTAGSLMAMGLTPMLAERIGWRSTAWFFGFLTMFFGILEIVLGQSAPEWMSEAPSPTSRSYHEQNGQLQSKLRRWCRVLLAPAALATFAAHAIHNFVRYFLMAWMPSYYREVLLVSADAAGLHLILPELCGLIFSLGGATLGREMQQRGLISPLGSRRLFASVAFIGSFVGLMTISRVTKVGTVTLFLCCVQGLATLQGLGFGASYLDISKYNGGLVTGVGNTIATGASYLAPAFAGWVLPNDHTTGPESWRQLFFAFAVSNLIGLVLYVPFISVIPLDVRQETKEK